MPLNLPRNQPNAYGSNSAVLPDSLSFQHLLPQELHVGIVSQIDTE